MMSRCYDMRAPNYKNYGARGIKVCEAWHSREAFIDWAIAFGDLVLLTLDRVDVNGDYTIDNCRWATVQAQLNNTTRSRYIEFNGATKTLKDWAIQLKLGRSTLWRRLARGLPLSKAMQSGPLQKPWQHGTRAGYECHKCRCKMCKASNAARAQNQKLKRINNEKLPRLSPPCT